MKLRYIYTLLGVALFLSFLVTALAPLGYISIDEAIYHLLAKNFVETGSFSVPTGYDEISAEGFVLRVPTSDSTLAVNGELQSTYPYLNSVLPAPFYFLFGYQGLFLLNFLSLIAVCIAILSLTNLLIKEKNVGIITVFIFLFSTYALDYGLAAWPHMSSLAFVVWGAFFSIHPKAKGRFLLLGGFLFGLAMGLRLDSLFGIAGSALCIIFLHNHSIKRIFIFMIGTLPGLLLLSWTNLIKFGIFFPLVSREDLHSTFKNFFSLSPIFAFIPLFLFLFLLSWTWIRSYLRRPVICVPICLAIVFFFHQDLFKLLWGSWKLLFDLDESVIFAREQGNTPITSLGHITFMGGVKKGFFQSCPLLLTALLPFISPCLYKTSRKTLLLILLVPAPYLLFFSYYHWHGGLSLNLRYFTPLLPFFSILSGVALSFLFNLSKDYLVRILLYSLLGSLIFLIGFFNDEVFLEYSVIYFPHLILFFLALSMIGIAFYWQSEFFVHSFALFSMIALSWGCVTNNVIDLNFANQARFLSYNIRKPIVENLSENCLLISGSHFFHHDLIEEKHCYFFSRNFSHKEEVSKVVNFFHAKGRGVFILTHNSKSKSEWIEESFPNDGFKVIFKYEEILLWGRDLEMKNAS